MQRQQPESTVYLQYHYVSISKTGTTILEILIKNIDYSKPDKITLKQLSKVNCFYNVSVIILFHPTKNIAYSSILSLEAIIIKLNALPFKYYTTRKRRDGTNNINTEYLQSIFSNICLIFSGANNYKTYIFLTTSFEFWNTLCRQPILLL